MLLAGDIGSTRTNLAIFSSECGLRSPLEEATFYSANYKSLEVIISDFLNQVDIKVDRASFGVAGSVVAGRAAITNLPWVIDKKELKSVLNLQSILMMNDLEAIANAVPFLKSSDLHTLNNGIKVQRGNIAVIAPGKGLGEAFLTWNGSHYKVCVSQGGHTDFAATNLLEIEMLRYLQKRFGYVSYERVCSWQGLYNIYIFLKENGKMKEPYWLAERLAQAEDPIPIIVGAALDPEKSCEICVAALETLVYILGTEVSNLAIKLLANGGVYLGGGIPPYILPVLEKRIFWESFTNKGRMSEILTNIPIHVILNPKTVLLGAACEGLRILK